MAGKKARVVAAIQARMGSTRLPGKVLMDLCGRPMLAWLIERVLAAKSVDEAVVITSDNAADDGVAELAKREGVRCYRGSEHDVVDRCYQSAKEFGAEIFVRITADNPFTDPRLIDEMVSHFTRSGNLDFLENSNPSTFPYGLNFEVMSFSCLERLWKETRGKNYFDRFKDHITSNPGRFRCGNHAQAENMSGIRLTVDYPEDMDLARKLFAELLKKERVFLTEDVLALLRSRPILMAEATRNINKKSG